MVVFALNWNNILPVLDNKVAKGLTETKTLLYPCLSEDPLNL